MPHSPPVVDHKHPAYLNAACLPFASEYYNIQEEDDNEYESYFKETKKKNKLAMRMVVLMHYDINNRKEILLKSQPVYGT